LPHPGLALADPVDGGCEPLVAGRVGLRVDDPLGVVTLLARRESLELRQCGGLLLQAPPPLLRYPDRPPLSSLHRAELLSRLVETGGLLHIAEERLVSRQIRHRFEPPELSHRGRRVRVLDLQRAVPEAEGAVLLERRHAAEDAVVLEARRAPL